MGLGALAGTIEMTSRADGVLSGELDGAAVRRSRRAGGASLDAAGGALSLWVAEREATDLYR